MKLISIISLVALAYGKTKGDLGEITGVSICNKMKNGEEDCAAMDISQWKKEEEILKDKKDVKKYAALAGSISGVVFFILCVIIGLCCYCKKSKSEEETTDFYQKVD